MQIGIDFGGTKIEAAALDNSGAVLARIRKANPGNYADALRTVQDLVGEIEREAGCRGSIGIGTPGSISPSTSLMRNSNSLYLNGRNFRADLVSALGRDVRMANDANCFALSEAVDGAGAGGATVFGIILGTGCGGGLVVNGQLINGAHGIAGEWGHNPLPWASLSETPGPACYCGQRGCLEQWISGTGLQRDFFEQTRGKRTAEQIISLARSGAIDAEIALENLVDRLGRALAQICNIIDPDVIVVGGGLSNVPELYEGLSDTINSRTFSDIWDGSILPAKWGDSSGVRGAARLWPASDTASSGLTRQDAATAGASDQLEVR